MTDSPLADTLTREPEPDAVTTPESAAELLAADGPVALRSAQIVETEATVAPRPTPTAEPEPAKPVVRFSLIDPDQRWVMIVAIVLFVGILAAALTSSFTSVYAMSAWVGLPAAFQWLPAIFLDMAIVGYTWGLIVFKRRNRDIGWARLGLTISTSLSVSANATHTLDFWKGHLTSYQSVLGIILSAGIPLLALLATEVLIRLVFANPEQAGSEAKPAEGTNR